ncbi:unnamed protein product [Cuscuta campestris]|uniref:Uncharacterized protein n=1 Tax=Cuscuta campestris TaxID=132261 RepID=A0A484NDW9_9ASTE|nr:unnamed protein product [Cuscuta campestris]
MAASAEGARTAPPWLPPTERVAVNSSAVRKVLCSMQVFPAACGNTKLEGKMTAADVSSPLALAKRNLELAASELSALRSSLPLTSSGFRLRPDYDHLITLLKSFRTSPRLMTAPRPSEFPEEPRYDEIKSNWGECRVIFEEVKIVLEGALEKLGGGGEGIGEEEEIRVGMVRSLARGRWHMDLCYVGLTTEGSGWVESFSPIHDHLWDYSAYSGYALFVLSNPKEMETRMMMMIQDGDAQRRPCFPSSSSS